MPYYIFKPRRGTASQWASATMPLQPNELGIEYTDDGTMARIIIGGENGEVDTFGFSALTRIRTISLPAENWVGENASFTQTLAAGTISGVTANSKIDLQPTAEQLEYLADEEITLVTENNAGVVTVYALHYKPEVDMQIQATITEVASNE